MLPPVSLEQYTADIDTVIEANPTQEDISFDIRCNDCGFKGSVRYHPYGMKCGDCGGYNTTR